MAYFASETAVFAVALGVTVVLALIELGRLVRGHIPERTYGQTPSALQSHSNFWRSARSRACGWLARNRVSPLSCWLVFLLGFGLSGLIFQEAIRRHVIQLPSWIGMVVATAAGLCATHFFARGTAQSVFAEDMVCQNMDALIGRLGVVFRGSASIGRPAKAKICDADGKSHYVLVEPYDIDHTLPQGTHIIIVRREGSILLAREARDETDKAET